MHIVSVLEDSMPALPYHNIDHIYDVLNAAMNLATHEGANDDDRQLLRLAALLHDIGFIRSGSNHEEHGVALASEILPAFGLSDDQIQIISGMILATRLPQSPLTILEQGVVETEREWNLVQRTFLQSHRYHTTFAKANREPQKQERMKEVAARIKQAH
jgi:uncharacterized protein